MRKIRSKTYIFEQMPVIPAIAQMSIPMIISSLVSVLYNLADTFFVGFINDPVQNAAVTLTYPLTLAFNAVSNLFGFGTSSMMSRLLGKRQYERVRQCSAFGFYGAFICSLGFSLLSTLFRKPLVCLLGADVTTLSATLDYLFWTVNLGVVPAILNVVMGQLVRAEGSAVHASIGTMSGCLMNIVLDPLFIMPWGLNMGAAGAGCATFISNCCATLYFLILCRNKKGSTYVSMNFHQISREKHIILGILEVGIPATIQNILNVATSAVQHKLVAAAGAEAVAAMGIASKINGVPSQIFLGAGQGIMPLVSYNYASGNRKRMKQFIRTALSVSVPIVAAMSAVFYLAADNLIRIFMDLDSVAVYGAHFLRALSLSMVFNLVDYMIVNIFQAMGFGKQALQQAIIRKIIMEFPAMYLLNRLFPIYGIAYAPFCAELVIAIVASVMLHCRIRKLDQTYCEDRLKV